jgi:hypothetical protein
MGTKLAREGGRRRRNPHLRAVPAHRSRVSPHRSSAAWTARNDAPRSSETTRSRRASVRPTRCRASHAASADGPASGQGSSQPHEAQTALSPGSPRQRVPSRRRSRVPHAPDGTAGRPDVQTRTECRAHTDRLTSGKISRFSILTPARPRFSLCLAGADEPFVDIARIATRQSCSSRCWGLLRRCRSSQ